MDRRLNARATFLLLTTMAFQVPACGGNVDANDGNPAESGTGDAAADDGSALDADADGDQGSQADVHDAEVDTVESGSDAPPDAEPLQCADSVTCPSSSASPTMVEVPCVNGGEYCIDSTEVTRAQYGAFLQSGWPITDQPAECAFNAEFPPDSDCESDATVTNQPAHPQVCVDWCDAAAYCAWAGKRLCHGAFSTDAANNEWTNACTAGGTRLYCYGDDWEADLCNDHAYGAGTTTEAGSLLGCVGGYAGIYDMTGNVSEWQDVCRDDGSGVECILTGGDYALFPGLEVECVAGATKPLAFTSPRLGFRCCY